MSEENNNQGGENTTPQTPVFDAKSFREEMIQTNRELIENAIGAISTNFESRFNSLEANRAVAPEVTSDNNNDIADYQEYAKQIGVDEDQLSGIVKLVTKAMQKQTGNFENSLLTKVDKNLDLRDQKKYYTDQTAREFPDILNKQSKLFKATVDIYNQMSPETRKAPDAERIATERAALRLGIAPLNLAAIQARDANNESGNGAGGKAQKEQEISAEFAQWFNVDMKKANEHYQRIQSRNRQ
jgi:hypothetical protein